MKDPSGILMVEPEHDATPPVLDVFTRKITAAWRDATTDERRRYRGFHLCRCGAMSDNADHYIDGLLTNSLCVHYVACHRFDLSPAEMEKVAALTHGEAEPTLKELGRALR